MQIIFIKPRPELARYVDTFWIFSSAVGFSACGGHVSVPNGCAKLAFAYGDSFTQVANGRSLARPEQRLNLEGVRQTPYALISSGRPIASIGVEFHPHGAYPFFGLEMSEIANHIEDADAVLGSWVRTAQRALVQICDPRDKVAFLENQLLLRLQKNQPKGTRSQYELAASCTRLLQATDGRISMRDLARQSGYSLRYIDLCFKQYIGVAPKTLAGIFRFHKFYRAMAAGTPLEVLKRDLYWLYCDQSHFIREFKKKTGRTPSQLFRYPADTFGRHTSLRTNYSS